MLQGGLTEADRFSYLCGRCNRCCRDKQIQVNPYEVARLMRALGTSRAELLERFTIDGLGEHLARREDGACVFLGPEGCTVHADRPLVCRLYPLGRRVFDDGHVEYGTLEGHPQSLGRYGEDGTVRDYVSGQRTADFIAAADAYFFWLCAARDRLAAEPELGATLAAADILDLDSFVERRCEETGRDCPADLGERLSLHLRFLYELIGMEAPDRP